MTYYRLSNDVSRSISENYAVDCIQLTYKDKSREEIINYLKRGGFYQTKYATYCLTDK